MKKQSAIFYIILVSCLISLIRAAPKPQTSSDELNFNALDNGNIDYNAMMANFKEFFAYLPAMFSTVKDTMSGFPKLAEGIKILTLPNYDNSHENNELECKCKNKSTESNDDTDKSLTHDFR